MLRKFTYLLFVFLFLSNVLVYAQKWTIKNIPNPKELNNTFVANPDKILLPKTVDEINETLQELEDKTTAKITLVMLKSIGQQVPKVLANDLFSKWEAAQNDKNKDLLILFVLDQHRIEFATSNQAETVFSQEFCNKIQQEEMLPDFKQKKYGAGMLKGVQKIAEILIAQQNLIPDKSSLSNELDTNQSAPAVSKPAAKYNSKYSPKLDIYITCMELLTLVYFLFFVIAHLRKDYYHKYQTLRPFSAHIWWIIFPIPFTFFHFLNQFYLEKWRNAPRNSPETGFPMHKLTEDEDDVYLQSGQITEETTKSLDYDVWVSGAPNDILILSYEPYFSIYQKCSNCNYRAYTQVYDKVVVAPTHTSSGVGERKYECRHCHYSDIKRYTILPKMRKSHRW